MEAESSDYDHAQENTIESDTLLDSPEAQEVPEDPDTTRSAKRLLVHALPALLLW